MRIPFLVLALGGLCACQAMPPEGALILTADQLPDWLETTVETEALRTDYAALHEALAHMRPPDADTLGPLRVAVLRVLIVHAWRRLVLRHPALPRALHSDQWRGHDCAARVRDLLDHLPRPALTDI